MEYKEKYKAVNIVLERAQIDTLKKYNTNLSGLIRQLIDRYFNIVGLEKEEPVKVEYVSEIIEKNTDDTIDFDEYLKREAEKAGVQL